MRLRARGFMSCMRRALDAMENGDITAEQCHRRLEWLHAKLAYQDHAKVMEDYEYTLSYARMRRSQENKSNRRSPWKRATAV